MKRKWAAPVLLAAGSLVTATALSAMTPQIASAANGPVTINGTASPAATTTPTTGAVPAGSEVDFELSLAPRNAVAAQAFATAVATPGNAGYHHYLTPAEWEAQYSPTAAQVKTAKQWLTGAGLTVGSVSPDRLSIDASGTEAQVASAFQTNFAYHQVDGHALRLAGKNVTIPGDLAGIVTGVSGLSQVVATPADTTGSTTGSSTGATTAPDSDAAVAATTIPQPPGYRSPAPCGSSFSAQQDTTDPAYGNGYPSPDNYVVCGYTPPQLRSAYGAPANGGKGQTVAIVDAYVSPTLLSDTQTYDAQVDPSNILNSANFSESLPKKFNDTDACDASGWFGEQTLDVEAVHGLAPQANILYAGAKNCETGLYDSVRQIVDAHAADVVTNSYGDDAGDLLDSAADRNMFDNIAVMAAGTGVSLLFSSGDDGDEFATTGYVAADFPASDPNITAVGGTSLAIDATGKRTAEYGWATGRSYLCSGAAIGTMTGCTKKTQGTWLPVSTDGGGGGGTSINYLQPAYQKGVVPDALAERNQAITGTNKMRVEPDISAVADPGTGFLVGETQTFPQGVYYDTYRIGGTSLASPTTAGLIADANAKAGTDLGFLNPALYSLKYGAGVNDVLPTGLLDQARVDYANSVDASGGLLTSTRLVTYEGTESFCDGTGNCATRPNALTTAKGYDSMTGLGSPGTNFIGQLAKSAG